MREFVDVNGDTWVATALEEETPRYHGRWFLVFHPQGDPSRILAMPEVRWQNRHTAERTLNAMGRFELRRRIHLLLEREHLERGASPETGALVGRVRAINANAG
jgi:hypothetical protein